MSTSETDSEPESELLTESISTLARFAHLSATRPDPGLTSRDTSTVRWAVDTLATLDFRLVRKDNALHGLIQNCAYTILALFDTVLQQGPESGADSSSDFIPDVASILRSSFLHLLFQYRRLFRVIATRDFKPNSTPLAVICWVDVVLAKLGDVVAFIAAGLDSDQSLPESLKGQREEDNLRAAIQLPDNWDMLPSMLLSERASLAAKRLSIRLILGRYILHPALSGQAGVDNTIIKLHSIFAEFVRQSATRADELRSVLEPSQRYLIQQERLTSAMAISLFAATDMARAAIDLEHVTGFRPQTMATVMQLLRFVLDLGGHLTPTNVLNPVDHLDIPTSVVLRWGIIPQWTWSIWLEYRNCHADTILYITTAYIQYYNATTGASLDVSDLMSTNSRSNNQTAVISVMIDLVFRLNLVLSACGHPRQLSPSMMSVLHGACRLISQWINQNSCGIQNSKECCKALIVLFGYSSQNDQNFILNDTIIECLALMEKQCIHDAWKAAAEDKDLYFREALCQSFTRTRVFSADGLPKSGEVYVAQLMQFVVVMMFKGVNPLNMDPFVEFAEAVGERIFAMPANDRRLLHEVFLVFLAIANLSQTGFLISKVSLAADDEVIWHLGMYTGEVNLFVASAFALYITSSVISVEPLTYLEGLEYLLDIALLVCSRQYPREDEALALIVLPTICDALTRLLEFGDDTTVVVVDHTLPRHRHRPPSPHPRGDPHTSEPTRLIATPPRSLTRNDVISISGGPGRGLAETSPYVHLSPFPIHRFLIFLSLQPADATRCSTPTSADSTASSSSSAPHTPLFPATSADFLLFPSHPFCKGNVTTHSAHSPSFTVPFFHEDACESSQSELARLRSEAFSELQRSVQENGEGFIKRMREFEDSRSRSAQHSRAKVLEKRRRKRYSPSVPTTKVTGKVTVSDDDDDVLILASTPSESIHPRQKRSSSLGAMDDTNFHETNSSGRLSLISNIFQYASHVPSNTTTTTINQSSELSSFHTSFDSTNSLHTNAFKPTLSHPTSYSLASSVDRFSSTSYAEDVQSLSSPMVSPPQSPSHPSTGSISNSASSAEKVIAALTLAMANGAGSLGDYEAVRALNISSLDGSQVGELWH
ncbi:hypothetical protein JVU11DRAFT_5286 [Chiua virens]|nr:hypothetical protein JVU11DRAFT_5286 [Chiua virens]